MGRKRAGVKPKSEAPVVEPPVPEKSPESPLPFQPAKLPDSILGVPVYRGVTFGGKTVEESHGNANPP